MPLAMGGLVGGTDGRTVTNCLIGTDQSPDVRCQQTFFRGQKHQQPPWSGYYHLCPEWSAVCRGRGRVFSLAQRKSPHTLPCLIDPSDVMANILPTNQETQRERCR